MSTLKQRLHRKNSNGEYDIIHLETSASLVKMTDGTDVESILTNMTSIPSGLITMWSGASTAIPSGWLLCNGENGTPDLRNRFIVGAGDEYEVGATGGEKTHTLTTEEMPSHTHTFTGKAHTHTFTGTAHKHTATFTGTAHTHTATLSNGTAASAGDHTHGISDVAVKGVQIGTQTAGNRYSAEGGSSATTDSAGAHTHTVTATVTNTNTTAGGTVTVANTTAGGTNANATQGGTNSNTGGGTAHENRPPYYALCFIMKL